MIYVIGSGPAGVSAAMALVNSGSDVTMLDAGFDLEPHLATLKHRLACKPREQWEDNLIQNIKSRTQPHTGGVSQKLSFGSDFSSRGMETHQPVVQIGAKIYRSLAKGGLSNIWGGTVLPFRDDDIKDWPISYNDLKPYYQSVFSFMPNTGKQDNLSRLFPRYFSKMSGHRLSRQSSCLYTDLLQQKKNLNRQGIYFGYSRLAVDFNAEYSQTGCVHCGLCLYGCPYDLIYSSAHTLEQLQTKTNFKYIPHTLVEKLSETGDRVEITARSIQENTPLIYTGSKVFLGAGVFSSTRIMLNSIEMYDRDIQIRHSDHFQIPLIRLKSVPGVTTEQLHTMTQITLDILDGRVDSNTVNMQIYAYNDLYKRVLDKKFKLLPSKLNFLVDSLLGRLLIIKGYLHSDVSANLNAKLVQGRNGKLIVTGNPNPAARAVLHRVNKKLLAQMGRLKALPVFLAAQLGVPGEANHSGGSFPMRINPASLESDILGRPFGFNHIHMIDSAVFPSVPATTITLTIMANAYRIAANSLTREKEDT